MAIPDFQTLMRPVLSHAKERAVRMPEVANQVAEEFRLSAEEQEELLPSGRQRLFYNRLAWANFTSPRPG